MTKHALISRKHNAEYINNHDKLLIETIGHTHISLTCLPYQPHLHKCVATEFIDIHGWARCENVPNATHGGGHSHEGDRTDLRPLVDRDTLRRSIVLW